MNSSSTAMATGTDGLFHLLNGFRSLRGLVLGDVMLDRFVYGSVRRISPEAPIPVMLIDRYADMPGGAGNVVRNLAALGASPSIVGLIGSDSWGESLTLQLTELAGVSSRLVKDRSRQTTVKTRYVAEGQQVLRADRETLHPQTAEIEANLITEFQLALEGADFVLLSDYGKGVLSDRILDAAIGIAKAAGKPVVVDPKGTSFDKYRGATLLKPNRQELQLVCGFECATDEQVELAARGILQQGLCEMVVVTRGEDGMSAIVTGEPALHLRTAAREVFDVSGAGDTVAATLALALAAGGSIQDACSLANLAAGIVVGKRGTAIVTAGEIAMALRPFNDVDEHHNLFSLDHVTQLVRDWRAQGLTIAFTNGCFDLLHPGHVSLIERARRTADRLIIGLNADVSVRRMKGPSRPVQGEVSRATVLASLKSVDAVVIFSEDTPLAVIDALSPDVLIKGSDYTLEQVVGAELVTLRGGKVVLADIVAGHSTTRTVERFQKTA